MSVEDNLTYLQKVAVKGEVAFALSTASHDAEMKLRIYLILKGIDSKLKPFVLDCIKESVTFDETIIDKIYLEILNNTVPVWLWIDEIIADIKLHLNTASAGTSVLTGMRLSIDKVQERKNLIESAFLMFAREVLLLSPNSAEQLFNNILDDYDLEFLHGACFYLKNCCPEIRAFKGEEKEAPEELLSCFFDIKKTLSFSVETKSLSLLDRARQEREKFYKISDIDQQPEETFIIQGNILDSSNTITNKELSDYLSKKISELFEGVTSASTKPSSDTVYIVKKVFTNSGLSTDIRTCKTEKEALDFIRKIVKEYPELVNVCEFQVCAEKINEKQKREWDSKET